MTFNNALNAVKQSLKRYLDQKQDRENEQTTVQAIREGIEFKGSNIWILIFAIFMAFSKSPIWERRVSLSR